MNLTEIANTLNGEFEKIRSIQFETTENGIDVYMTTISSHDKRITYNQLTYLKSFKNIIRNRCSKSQLAKKSKYAASALIDAAKTYPDVDFYI